MPRTINIAATKSSSAPATCGGIVTRSPMTSKPTRNSVVVWPKPQKAPISDAHLKLFCSLTIVETAIK